MSAVRNKNDRDRIESIFQAKHNHKQSLDYKHKKVTTGYRHVLLNQQAAASRNTKSDCDTAEDAVTTTLPGTIVPTSPLRLLSPDHLNDIHIGETNTLIRGGKTLLNRQSSHPNPRETEEAARHLVKRQSSVGASGLKESLKSKVSPSSSLQVGSCPNLRAQFPSPNLRPKNPRNRAGSDVHRKPGMADTVSSHSLNVPDVFTTSFTYNTKGHSHTGSKMINRPEKTRACTPKHAGDGISITFGGDDASLANASVMGSDYDLQMTDIVPTIYRCGSTEGLYHRDLYMSQILDFLYLGSVEAAYNAHIMCKLDITSIVDLSNITSAEEHIFKTKTIPCLCPLQGNHPRSRFRLTINDSAQEDFSAYFCDINKFIEGNRKKQKGILIYSYQGLSRAPTAVIQYLMQCHDMALHAAYALVKSRRPDVNINQGFQKCLENLERQLNPSKGKSLVFRSDSFADSKGRIKAWSDT